MVDEEQQIIIRFPEDIAQEIRTMIERRDKSKQLEIATDQQDPRNWKLKFGNTNLDGRLLDLPCIIESQKSFGGQIFYKSNDICQMLVCTPQQEESEEQKQTNRLLSNKTRVSNGITKGTKNIRSRCYRKQAQEKSQEITKVEKMIRKIMDRGVGNNEEEIVIIQEANENM